MSVNVTSSSPRGLVPALTFGSPRRGPSLNYRRTKVGEGPPWPGPQGGSGQCDKREGASPCPEVVFV